MANNSIKRWGDEVENPSIDGLRSALAELDKPEDEYQDCWVSNEENWSLAFFSSGLAILENTETGEEPWFLKNVGRELALKIWQSFIYQWFDKI